MNFLLVGDTHFVDSPLDFYRWEIFDVLKKSSIEHQIDFILFLGDTIDRKDKHTAKLVYRFIDELTDLKFETQTEVAILSGNHDKPVEGPYYWQFLSKFNIPYITTPQLLHDHIWLLPYSHSPISDWEGLDISSKHTIMMHQTIAGAMIECDRVLTSAHKLPKLPTKMIFSGDVHRPQTVGDVIYVGTPHPIKFSESWANRIILIKNSDFSNPIDIWLDGMQRQILKISSFDELNELELPDKIQIKLQYILKSDQLGNWAVTQQKIRQWAEEKKINLVSLETQLEGRGIQTEDHESLEIMSSDEIIREFGKQENLPDDVVNIGIELLKET